MRPVDFQFNYPLLGSEAAVFASWLHGLDSAAMQPLLASRPGAGRREDRMAAQIFLAEQGLPVPLERLFLVAGGHHALTLAIQLGQLAGSAIATDAVTYSNFFGIAAAHRVEVIPCAGDQHGMLPEALLHAAKAGARAVYLMPTVHNPLGTVMPLDRRRALAAVAREAGLLILEDEAYAFLEEAPPPPFAQLLPEQTFYLYSPSKPFAPLLKAAILVAPTAFAPAVEPATTLGSSGTSLLFCSSLSWLLTSGTLAATIRAKRAEGHARQRLAREMLPHCTIEAHPSAYHLWVLPERVAARQLCDGAAKQGVMLSDSAGFVRAGDTVPNAFRLALGGESDRGRIQHGLEIVAGLLHGL